MQLDPFGYIIKRSQQAIRTAMDKRLVDIDLTAPQYAALSELSKEQGLSNAELARRCFVTPQTMHQLIVGLESRGLIERSQHPDHRRIQQVRTTKTGKQLLAKAHIFVNEILETMMQDLSEAEIRQASEILTKCYTALEVDSG